MLTPRAIRDGSIPGKTKRCGPLLSLLGSVRSIPGRRFSGEQELSGVVTLAFSQWLSDVSQFGTASLAEPPRFSWDGYDVWLNGGIIYPRRLKLRACEFSLLSISTMSFTGQSRPHTSWIICSDELVEAPPSHGLIKGPGSSIFLRRGVGASIRRPLRSVGVITSATSWASGSWMSSRSTLVSSLDHLLDPCEFSLVAPPLYRLRRALIGASSSSVGPMTTVRLCYRHEEGVVLRGLPSNVRKQITEATYQPRLPDLR